MIVCFVCVFIWFFSLCFFFFFKQKTAYEMRISDWSSDVCSSDLVDDVFATLATELPTLHAQTLLGLSNALTRLWGRDAMIAGFQKRSLSALSHAWKGDGADAFAVAADTGSGRTEAAAITLLRSDERRGGEAGVRT